MIAELDRLDEIFSLYEYVVNEVNKTNILLGWNTKSYPDIVFVREAIEKSQMHILLKDGKVVAAGVVNHNVNKEYDDIDWRINEPKSGIATIHALAVSPDYRGKSVADEFLFELETYCRNQNDVAIHLDVIDTNIPAYKLYQRNGYEERACIKMYYEVVGVREFWMLEKVL